MTDFISITPEPKSKERIFQVQIYDVFIVYFYLLFDKKLNILSLNPNIAVLVVVHGTTPARNGHPSPKFGRGAGDRADSVWDTTENRYRWVKIFFFESIIEEGSASLTKMSIFLLFPLILLSCDCLKTYALTEIIKYDLKIFRHLFTAVFVICRGKRLFAPTRLSQPNFVNTAWYPICKCAKVLCL